MRTKEVDYSERIPAMDNSPLDRVGIRRVLLSVEETLKETLKQYMFEVNDKVTRSSVSNMVGSYLHHLKDRNALNDFKVICDETNNEPDNHNLEMNVYIQPKSMAEFINLHCICSREGAEFTDLVVEERSPVPEHFFRMD